MAEQSHAHEIREDWKPSFLSNDEFAQLMLEVFLDIFVLSLTSTLLKGACLMFMITFLTFMFNFLGHRFIVNLM